MKEIELTRNQVTFVDDDKFDWLNQWKWYARWDSRGNNFYAVRDIYKNNKRFQIQMAREIMNCPNKMEIDHINQNTLDNRKVNLRIATRKQNALNRNLSLPKSGIRGVQLTPYGTFRAGISINGKLKYFPTRRTLDEAIRDRKLAEIEYYDIDFLPKT